MCESILWFDLKGYFNLHSVRNGVCFVYPLFVTSLHIEPLKYPLVLADWHPGRGSNASKGYGPDWHSAGVALGLAIGRSGCSENCQHSQGIGHSQTIPTALPQGNSYSLRPDCSTLLSVNVRCHVCWFELHLAVKPKYWCPHLVDLALIRRCGINVNKLERNGLPVHLLFFSSLELFDPWNIFLWPPV